jgi:hypothetical protein
MRRRRTCARAAAIRSDPADLHAGRRGCRRLLMLWNQDVGPPRAVRTRLLGVVIWVADLVRGPWVSSTRAAWWQFR